MKATELQLRARKYVDHLLPALALIYAAFAGLRTVAEPDLGWQLATGRWIVQHRAIPSVDVLSYTGAGQEWIYPALSQVILYCTFLAGGYVLLSWLAVAACAGTVALTLRRGQAATTILALIAVPIIAQRTPPRAEMFSEVLLAAFVSVLWHYHRTGRGPLSVLPPLMFLWVNLHLGFIAGLGMCAAYVFLDLGEVLVAERRATALDRLRKSGPWLLMTFCATFLNPWGFRNYVGMVRVLPVHSTVWITELDSLSFKWRSLAQALAWREPKSAVWWLIAAALLAIIAGVFQKRFAAVIVLAVAVYECFHSVRLAGPFAIVVTVIGGSIIAEGFDADWLREAWGRAGFKGSRFRPAVAGVVLCAVAGFAAIRIADLVSDRYYLRTPDEFSIFGSGVASWYPEEAASFIKREHLPGNIYSEYTVGGFASWRLLPKYPDYIDGRGGPFGSQLFFRSLELLQQPLDSAQWTDEGNRRGINTAVILLNHSLGQGLLNISGFCKSQGWRTVYMDTRAAVFVRQLAGAESLPNLPQIDCGKVQFDQAPTGSGIRGNAERFSYYLDAAGILNALGRSPEALEKLEMAERIFQASADLHYLKAVALYSTGSQGQAEKELRRSLELAPSEQTSTLLAMLYRDQGRYGEGATVLSRAVEQSAHPHQLYLELGVLNLDMGQPAQALTLFDEAEKSSPYQGDAASLSASFNALLADGRESAWSRLAELYEARGLAVEAQQARARAASFEKSGNSEGAKQ